MFRQTVSDTIWDDVVDYFRRIVNIEPSTNHIIVTYEREDNLQDLQYFDKWNGKCSCEGIMMLEIEQCFYLNDGLFYSLQKRIGTTDDVFIQHAHT